MVVLHVTVQGCSRLSDPATAYSSQLRVPDSTLQVKVTCGDCTHLTMPVPSCEAPNWCEACCFNLDAIQWDAEVLHVAVHRCRSSQRALVLGSTRVSLTNLRMGEPREQWYALSTRDPSRFSRILLKVAIVQPALMTTPPSKPMLEEEEFSSSNGFPTSSPSACWPPTSRSMRVGSVSLTGKASSVRSRCSVVVLDVDEVSHDFDFDDLHSSNNLFTPSSYGDAASSVHPRAAFPRVPMLAPVSWCPPPPMDEEDWWLNVRPAAR